MAAGNAHSRLPCGATPGGSDIFMRVLAAGLGPKAAVERSRQLVGGHVRAFGIPLLLLTLAPRAVLTGRHWLLAALPPRLWTQVRLLDRAPPLVLPAGAEVTSMPQSTCCSTTLAVKPAGFGLLRRGCWQAVVHMCGRCGSGSLTLREQSAGCNSRTMLAGLFTARL
jgi:hypothetical protein